MYKSTELIEIHIQSNFDSKLLNRSLEEAIHFFNSYHRSKGSDCFDRARVRIMTNNKNMHSLSRVTKSRYLRKETDRGLPTRSVTRNISP